MKSFMTTIPWSLAMQTIQLTAMVELRDLPAKKFFFSILCFPPLDKLVVGSYQGLLRIYNPQDGGYVPAHMMLEKQLDPIVQVAIGRFATYVCIMVCTIYAIQ